MWGEGGGGGGAVGGKVTCDLLFNGIKADTAEVIFKKKDQLMEMNRVPARRIVTNALHSLLVLSEETTVF